MSYQTRIDFLADQSEVPWLLYAVTIILSFFSRRYFYMSRKFGDILQQFTPQLFVQHMKMNMYVQYSSVGTIWAKAAEQRN